MSVWAPAALSSRSVNATGEKTKYGVQNPLRMSQIETLVREQADTLARAIPEHLAWHPLRPTSMSIAEWRSWLEESTSV